MDTLARRIAEAPLDPDAWPAILKDIAEASGGWAGQLFAVADGRFCVDLAGGVSADLLAELDRRGGADPAQSPRAKAFFRSAPMTLASDAEYLSAAERDRSAIYREFFHHTDVDSHYCTTALLDSRPDAAIGFAVSFSRRQGPPDGARSARLADVLPHLRAAARLQLRIEDEGAALTLGALDNLALPAVICDFAGRITAASGTASAILASGAIVTQRAGRLTAVEPASAQRLEAAMRRGLCALGVVGPRGGTVTLASPDGATTIAADISPLPESRNSFRLSSRLLVVLGGKPPSRERLDAILRELGLTPAEADIVYALSKGASPLEIAGGRGVTLATVRSQIRSVYAKLGVTSRAELTERLRGLG